MGEPLAGYTARPPAEFNRWEGATPREVKHLSSERNRKRRYSPSSGERKGNSPNLYRASLQALRYGGCGALLDHLAAMVVQLQSDWVVEYSGKSDDTG
jgi:hypothetical protein